MLLLSNGFYLPILIFENGENILLIYLIKMKIGIDVQNTHSVNHGVPVVHILGLLLFLP